MKKERLVKTKSAAARQLERRLNEFEAVVRLHESTAPNVEIENDYVKQKRELRNILRSLVNLVEDGEPL